jgi:hypothetical protein
MIRSVLVSMYIFLRYTNSQYYVLRSLEADFLITFRRSSGSKNPCGAGLLNFRSAWSASADIKRARGKLRERNCPAHRRKQAANPLIS